MIGKEGESKTPMREEEMTKEMRLIMEVLGCVWLVLCVILTAWIVFPLPQKPMAPDYLNAFIGAVFGTASSVGLAYVIYIMERRRERKSAKKALMDGLRFNDDRAVQMLGQFAVGVTPNYQFDTAGLIIWISRSEGLFNDKLVRAINWHRYQMDHANTILATYYVFARLTSGSDYSTGILAADHREAVASLTTIHNGTHTLLVEIAQESTTRDVS